MSVSEEKENSPSSICYLLVANDERKGRHTLSNKTTYHHY